MMFFSSIFRKTIRRAVIFYYAARFGALPMIVFRPNDTWRIEYIKRLGDRNLADDAFLN
jgi:hypothetical protein